MGAVVSRLGFLDEINGHHILGETYKRVSVIVKRLGSVIREDR